MRKVERVVTVENKRYRIVFQYGELFIERVGYRTYGFFNDELSGFDLWEDAENPLHIIRTLLRDVIGFIKDYRIFYCSFRGFGESHKKLYNRLSVIIGRIAGFKVYSYKGTFILSK